MGYCMRFLFSRKKIKYIVGLCLLSIFLFVLSIIVNQPDDRLTYTISGLSPIYAIDISPDGRKIVAGSEDGIVRMWQTSDWSLVTTFEGHNGTIHGITFNKDGTQIVSGSYDQTIKIWQVSTGRLLRTIHSPVPIYSIVFSPDEKFLVVGGTEGTVQIWNSQSGDLANTLIGHRNLQGYLGVVHSVAFSEDGQIIISGGSDGTVHLWQTPSGRLLQRLTVDTRNSIQSVAFRPDSALLAVGGDEDTIRLWSIDRGTVTETLQRWRGGGWSIAFSPDGQLLASGGGVALIDGSPTRIYDTHIDIWNMSNGQLITKLKGHTKNVSSIAFSPDGDVLVSGGLDATLRVWQLETVSL